MVASCEETVPLKGQEEVDQISWQYYMKLFATHGLPKTLVSDNGTNFSSNNFEQFISGKCIKHIKLSQYHSA